MKRIIVFLLVTLTVLSMFVGCEKDLEFLERNRQLRLRNYQTLGFCGGVALVVLFI